MTIPTGTRSSGPDLPTGIREGDSKLPVSDETTLERWKERGVFLVACAALAGYVGLWMLTAPSEADTKLTGGQQTFVQSKKSLVPLPESSTVFAASEADAYWDESLPMRWVVPKVIEVTRDPITLDLPTPAYPVPSTLLPVPGPAVEFSKDLPRWPSFPEPGATE